MHHSHRYISTVFTATQSPTLVAACETYSTLRVTLVALAVDDTPCHKWLATRRGPLQVACDTPALQAQYSLRCRLFIGPAKFFCRFKT
jgi:hypothetical protein